MQRKTAPVCGSDVSCIVSLVDEKWAQLRQRIGARSVFLLSNLIPLQTFF